VKNRFKDILKKSSKLAAVPKSQLVSMEAVGDKSDEAQNVESFVIEREYLKTLLSHLRSSLSAEEREVFALYLKGYSYAEIAEKTSADSKKIDNILQKIKRKLRK
jgi:RNA polymerase sporulation-specific sigma factor